MFGALTEQSTQIAERSKKIAEQSSSEALSTLHVLLAIRNGPRSIAQEVLRNSMASAKELTLEEICSRADNEARDGLISFYTKPLAKVILCTIRIIFAMEDAFIGPHHLLLGILATPSCSAFQFLASNGVDTDALASECLQILGRKSPDWPSIANSSKSD